MKSYTYIFLCMALSLFTACEENESLPSHKVIGDAYATYVELTTEEDNPAANSTIQLDLKYSNYKEDPIKSIRILQKIGSGDGEPVEVSTIDESSAPVGKLVTKTIDYTVPNENSGVSVSIYVELKSAKEFPQVERIGIEIL